MFECVMSRIWHSSRRLDALTRAALKECYSIQACVVHNWMNLISNWYWKAWRVRNVWAIRVCKANNPHLWFTTLKPKYRVLYIFIWIINTVGLILVVTTLLSPDRKRLGNRDWRYGKLPRSCSWTGANGIFKILKYSILFSIVVRKLAVYTHHLSILGYREVHII